MASIFVKSTTTATTLFVFFCALSIATAFVVDTDGDWILNGGTYYIIPQSIGVGGVLIPTSGSDTSSCPLFYITRDKQESSPGSPITITSPLMIRFISPGFPITFSFQGGPNICFQPVKAWQVYPDQTTGKSYVAVSGDDFNPTFTIEDNNGEYKIKYVVNKDVKDVGFFENDGFLGITNEIPLPVVFKKASSILAMKV